MSMTDTYDIMSLKAGENVVAVIVGLTDLGRYFSKYTGDYVDDY